MTDSGQNLRKLFFRERNQGKTSNNSKIVSVDKDLERRSPKTRPVLYSLRPTVDMALIPLCNARFIKGHKPSNHIRDRIKSHVYTTE